jgi:HEAT repeat protein
MNLSGAAIEAEREINAEPLIARLRGLYDADRAVLELTALGPAAIKPLRRFLFQREPSGLYQPRVAAVDALAALKAADVLLDFLWRAPDVDIVDPVERTGEDAVINAAARALAYRRDDEVFAALIGIAAWRPLAGVIEALGEMRRKKAIPYLIEGLRDDCLRSAAERALIKIGAAARPALIDMALDAIPSVECETVSSLRTRRSAVHVLRDIGVTLEQWAVLQPLMWSPDNWLSALTCSLAFARGQPSVDKEDAVRRLFQLLRLPDWLLHVEIESWLAESYDVCLRVIAAAIEGDDPIVQDEEVRRSLLQITAKIAQANLSSTVSAGSGSR